MFQEKERQRIVDSIYTEGRINYASGDFRTNTSKSSPKAINNLEKNKVEEWPLILVRLIKIFFNMNQGRFPQ